MGAPPHALLYYIRGEGGGGRMRLLFELFSFRFMSDRLEAKKENAEVRLLRSFAVVLIGSNPLYSSALSSVNVPFPCQSLSIFSLSVAGTEPALVGVLWSQFQLGGCKRGVLTLYVQYRILLVHRYRQNFIIKNRTYTYVFMLCKETNSLSFKRLHEYYSKLGRNTDTFLF